MAKEDERGVTGFEQFLDSTTDLMFRRLVKMQPKEINLFASIADDIKKTCYKAHTKANVNYTPEELERLANVALIQFGIAWRMLNEH